MRSHSAESFTTREARPLGFSRSKAGPESHAARQALRLALLLALALLPGRAQQRPDPSQAPPYQQTGIAEQERALENFPNIDPAERERRLRAYNAERQKSMVSDANKLLKLARELDDEVSRTKPDSLTAAQLRKVAEIEKLARSVREKMSASVPTSPAYPRSFSPQFR
jgi:hypothetical protein